MITVAIVAVFLVTYWIIGSVYARRQIPAFFERAKELRHDFKLSYVLCSICHESWGHANHRSTRSAVMSQFRVARGVWPIHMGSLHRDRLLDRYDPAVVERQKTRIAELEKELGVGQ